MSGNSSFWRGTGVVATLRLLSKPDLIPAGNEKGVDAFACNHVRLLRGRLRLPDHARPARSAGARDRRRLEPAAPCRTRARTAARFTVLGRRITMTTGGAAWQNCERVGRCRRCAEAVVARVVTAILRDGRAAGVCAVKGPKRPQITGVASGTEALDARRCPPRHDLHGMKANMESASRTSVWETGHFPPCAVAANGTENTPATSCSAARYPQPAAS